MGVVIRRIYLQTLASGKNTLRLTQLLKNKNQSRLKKYLPQLQDLTITLEGKNTQVYQTITYHRGNLKYQFTKKINQALRAKTPYTQLDINTYCTLKSKYTQGLYELISKFKATGQIKIHTCNLAKRLATPHYKYPSQLKSKIIKPALARLRPLYECWFTLKKNHFTLTFKPRKPYDLNTKPNLFTNLSPASAG